MPTISQILAQYGYTGVTGTTPYRPSSGSQVTTLQNQYNSALNGQTITRSSAIQLTMRSQLSNGVTTKDIWSILSNFGAA